MKKKPKINQALELKSTVPNILVKAKINSINIPIPRENKPTAPKICNGLW